MPRNTKGKPVKRLKTEIKREGIAHTPDEMKSEDQGGAAGNPGKGHDTEKKGAHYGRKRH